MSGKVIDRMVDAGDFDPRHHMTLDDFEAAKMLKTTLEEKVSQRDGIIRRMAGDIVLLEEIRDRGIALYNWLNEHLEQLPSAHQNTARELIMTFREGLEALHRCGNV